MNFHRSLNRKEIGKVRRITFALVVISLPFFLGGWKIVRGRDINPAYLERIQDGKTKKHEILTLFGDPEEINRTPEGIVYIYKSFRDKEVLPKKERETQSTVQYAPYYAGDWAKKKSTSDPPDKELASMLIIRFDRDGETVQSHDYKKF